MKILGITANLEKDRASEAIKIVCDAARANGFCVVADPESAALSGGYVDASESVYTEADMVVALGGDGTMLRVTRELDGAAKPILGVNIGSLGFLTSIGLKDVPTAFKSLADGEYCLAERSLVECKVTRRGNAIGSYRALNDVVLTNASPARVVRLDVAVDSDDGMSFVGDGLIVCTPSGSTGYSLSSGGPIVHPGVKAITLGLICPQTLSSRPMVIPADKVIRITVQGSASKVILTMDGQVSLPLETGDGIEVGDSEKVVRFVQMADYSYFSVLRQKLHWRLSNPRDADS